MSLRKYMHSKNKYKTPPDFKKLGNLYPDFQEHVIVDISGRIRYNFNSEESLRILTQTLAKHDFDLDVKIPMGKLVPALPLRLNYVHWIEDLVRHTGLTDVSGIDIGTGAVAIYPLLCSKMNGWKMIGTDIDESTVQSARENVEKNHLDHLIKIIKVDDSSIIKDFSNDLDNNPRPYSFTMCNPPFYDIDEIKKKKRTPPNNASTGSSIELEVSGGEKAFVTKMIDESTNLRDKIKIYTTMVGQKRSAAFCRSEFLEKNIDNFSWTEFCQGNTKRWGMAWSFVPREQLDLVTSPSIRTNDLNISVKQKSRNAAELIFPISDQFKNVEDVVNKLKQWINELKIEIKDLNLENQEDRGEEGEDEDDNYWTYDLKAKEDTWTHSRRKRRMGLHPGTFDAKKLRLDDQDDQCTKIEKKDDVTTDDLKIDSTTESENTKEPFLQFTLGVKKWSREDNEEEESKSDAVEKPESVKICLIYQSGNKNGIESFKQYLMNKLGIREYLLQKSREANNKAPNKKKKKCKKSRMNRDSGIR